MSEMHSHPIRVRTVDWPDTIAGLIVIALASTFGAIAMGYHVGSPRQMGAGFFPIVLCIAIGLLGIGIVAKSIFAPEPTFERPDLRRFGFVSAAFLTFALGIDPVGLFLTVIATTLLSSLAHRDANLLYSLAMGIVLALAIWLVFVRLLGLNIPLLPAFA